MNDVAAIRELIARINVAWTTVEPVSNAAVLRAAFADDIIIRGAPGYGVTAQGREAAVASYVDFASATTVHAFESDEAAVDHFGDFALATYGWRIDYTIDFKRYGERGRDLFALRRAGDGWVAVWRMVLPADPG